MLETITIEPSQKATRCVIWLHGLGADGHDFENIVPALGLTQDHDIRFVFPHAPIRPVTLNQHIPMRAWYDIYTLDSLDQEDVEGIEASQKALDILIQQQQLDYQRIVLAGFSQGGALALLHGITSTIPFAGLIGLSTYLPFLHKVGQQPQIQHPNLPIFLCHGRDDDIIPSRLGEETRNYLMQYNQQTTWKTYAMGHQVCNDEIVDIGKWLRNLIFSE